jgi:hypothetical protein
LQVVVIENWRARSYVVLGRLARRMDLLFLLVPTSCQVVEKQFCIDLKRQKARIYSPW